MADHTLTVVVGQYIDDELARRINRLSNHLAVLAEASQKWAGCAVDAENIIGRIIRVLGHADWIQGSSQDLVPEAEPPATRPATTDPGNVAGHLDNRCGDRLPPFASDSPVMYCQAPAGHTGDHRCGITWWGPIADERTAVLAEVGAELARQDVKWGEQNHPDGTGEPGDREAAASARRACQDAALYGRLTWRDILTEEWAEARAETDPVALRGELVQVGAVAVQWILAIDRREADHGHVRPGGLLKYPKKLSPEAFQRLKTDWENLDNAQRVTILDGECQEPPIIEEDEDLSDCPYYRTQELPDAQRGTCNRGCSAEPWCWTNQPLGGWPSERAEGAP